MNHLDVGEVLFHFIRSMPMGLPFSSRDYVDKYETSETAGFFIKVNSNHVETMYQIYQVNGF